MPRSYLSVNNCILKNSASIVHPQKIGPQLSSPCKDIALISPSLKGPRPQFVNPRCALTLKHVEPETSWNRRICQEVSVLPGAWQNNNNDDHVFWQSRPWLSPGTAWLAQKLQLLSPLWPAPKARPFLANTTQIEHQNPDIRTTLMAEFPDVIKDSLNDSPMAGTPMELEFDSTMAIIPKRFNYVKRNSAIKDKINRQTLFFSQILTQLRI